MKLLISILTFIFATQVLAQVPTNGLEPIPLLEGDSYFLPLEGPWKLELLKPKCGSNGPCEKKSIVMVEYTLMGCADRAVTSSKVIDNGNGTYDVLISALNIGNEASKAMFCEAMPTANQFVDIVNGEIAEENVKVVFVGAESDPGIFADGAKDYSPISGNWTMADNVCPEGEKCNKMQETSIRVLYKLGSCSDSVVSFNTVLPKEDGKVDVVISAMKIGNSESCNNVVAPMYTEEITVGLGSIPRENINVIFMGTEEN